MRTRIWHSDWKPQWLIRCVSAALLSFMDKQENVCVLHSDGVDILSDLSGVLYIALDKEGAWQFKLAKEMKAVGIEIDMNKV